MNTGVDLMSRKLVTEEYKQSQRNFDEIADQFDRVIAEPLFENGCYYVRNFKSLQKCVDEAGSSGGGRVILQSGIVYEEAITMPLDMVSIWAPDPSATIHGVTMGHAVTISGANCGLFGMTLKTESGYSTNNSGLQIQAAAVQCTIEGVFISESDNRGITSHGHFVLIHSVTISPCDSYSIVIAPTSVKTHIIDCVLHGPVTADYPMWLAGESILAVGNSIGVGAVDSIYLTSNSSYCAVGFNYCVGFAKDDGLNNIVDHNPTPREA